jgi:hypothetical protein
VIDWTKPIEWVHTVASCSDPRVLKTYGTRLALVEWEQNGMPVAYVFDHECTTMRNVPEKPRELWAVYDKCGDFLSAYNVEADAISRRDYSGSSRTVVRMREVLP